MAAAPDMSARTPARTIASLSNAADDRSTAVAARTHREWWLVPQLHSVCRRPPGARARRSSRAATIARGGFGSLDRGALLVTTLAAVLAIAATWMISRRIVGPIAELSAAAGDLSAGKLDRR